MLMDSLTREEVELSRLRYVVWLEDENAKQREEIERLKKIEVRFYQHLYGDWEYGDD